MGHLVWLLFYPCCSVRLLFKLHLTVECIHLASKEKRWFCHTGNSLTHRRSGGDSATREIHPPTGDLGVQIPYPCICLSSVSSFIDQWVSAFHQCPKCTKRPENIELLMCWISAFISLTFIRVLAIFALRLQEIRNSLKSKRGAFSFSIHVLN